MRGEVNPADLFTNFMESRVKVEQLIGHFGCGFREGRAEAAPQLRREDLKEFEGAELGGEEDGEALAMDDAMMHDPDVLPDMYSQRDMKRFFPDIYAAPLAGFGESDPAPPGVHVHRPHKIRHKE